MYTQETKTLQFYRNACMFRQIKNQFSRKRNFRLHGLLTYQEMKNQFLGGMIPNLYVLYKGANGGDVMDDVSQYCGKAMSGNLR